ncbi:MAG: peptidase S41 [Rhizobiales bacterium 65-9]|nr:S41 family peptidase [Hyphomicrobiales bacterium]OJY37374.1 MAG: peptidase S41 [Rhizobiales bacterium 65-9]
MRKIAYLMVGAVLGAGVVTLGSQTRLLSSTSAVAASSETYRQLSLFGDVFERIRSDYVEKPDESKLIEAAINGMLSSLDPHSSYLDAKAHRDMQQSTQGKFGGLGIEVTMEEGLIKVVSPIDDTPAARAGILANDIITHIDKEQVQGLSLNQAVDKMRGAVGTEVVLRIVRQGRKDPLDVTLKRDTITVQAVRTRIDDDVAVIRVTTFNEQTFDGVRRGIEKAMSEVPADKLKGFVIDLRNNPGGLLDQSISVANAFLDRGEIVSTRGRNADETQRFNAKTKPGDLTKGKPVVVLINGGSASASEIVAGALQDHKRATLIGTRSFGKGSVQTIIPIGSAGAVRLTTARYYTPSGRSIQAKGISPDVIIQQDVPDELKGRDEQRGESSLRGHLTNSQGEEKSGSSSYVPPDASKDKQLIYAFDLLRGKIEKPIAPKAEVMTPPPAPTAVPADSPEKPKEN